MRALVRETRLEPGQLIYPLFVCPGEGVRREIGSMPGVFNLSVDEALMDKAKGRVIIGRSEKHAHLCIKNKSVSGEHLALIRRDSQFMVEDRESSNGTSLNGRKLVPYAPMRIEDGDLLLAGDVLLRFKRVLNTQ